MRNTGDIIFFSPAMQQPEFVAANTIITPPQFFTPWEQMLSSSRKDYSPMILNSLAVKFLKLLSSITTSSITHNIRLMLNTPHCSLIKTLSGFNSWLMLRCLIDCLKHRTSIVQFPIQGIQECLTTFALVLFLFYHYRTYFFS